MSMKKKWKKNIVNLAKKNLLFRNLIRKITYMCKRIFFEILKLINKTNENTIIFCCYAGKSYCCSPKAIYNYMVNNSKYDKFNYIWAFKETDNYKWLEKNKNTKVVVYDTREYKKYLAKSKYWIYNFKLPDYIYPKKNQVFVQCWHGTPLKRLGYDLIHFDNVLNTIDGMKKRYEKEAKKMSYFLSPSRTASERFISAWNLKEIGKENIILEKGYPRNDFLFHFTDKDKEKIKKQLGIFDCNKKIILYAPTYRGNQHESGLGYIYKETVDFEKLKTQLQDEFIILFRPHYFIANVFDFEKYKGFVYNVANIDDINKLYIISDILITDYSSVFFDYANLQKPIIFHMYDLDHYKNESNGFYSDINELPGNITSTDEELIEEIKNVINNFKYTEKYMKFNEKYNYLDDGYVSKRIVEEIIK